MSSSLTNQQILDLKTTVASGFNTILDIPDLAALAFSYCYLLTADAYIVSYGVPCVDDQIITFLFDSKETLRHHFQHQTKILTQHGFNLDYFDTNGPEHWVSVQCIKDHHVTLDYIDHDDDDAVKQKQFLNFKDCGTCVHSFRDLCTCKRERTACDQCVNKSRSEYKTQLKLALLLLPDIETRNTLTNQDKKLYTIRNYYHDCVLESSVSGKCDYCGASNCDNTCGDIEFKNCVYYPDYVQTFNYALQRPTNSFA